MIFIVREIHLIFHLSISCNMLGGDQIVNQRMEMKSKQFKGLCCEVFFRDSRQTAESLQVIVRI